MKKAILLVVMISLAGCANGFLRAGQPEQAPKQAQTTMKAGLRSEKIYRILEEKGTYYVVRLNASGGHMPEKELPRSEPSKAGIMIPDDKEKPPTQTQIPTPEKKSELKSEMPKVALPDSASREQAKGKTNLMMDANHALLAKIKEHSQKVKVSGKIIRKEFHVIGKKAKKKLSDTFKSHLGQEENKLKTLEDLSLQNGRSEVTIFFPQDKAYLLKGAPEHNKLNSFAEDISKRSAGKKVFLTLIGSASAKGDSAYNRKLSQRRAEFIKKILDGLLANVPHQYYRVYGQGDSQSPRVEDSETNEKYQNVRITAVYDVRQFSE